MAPKEGAPSAVRSRSACRAVRSIAWRRLPRPNGWRLTAVLAAWGVAWQPTASGRSSRLVIPRSTTPPRGSSPPGSRPRARVSAVCLRKGVEDDEGSPHSSPDRFLQSLHAGFQKGDGAGQAESRRAAALARPCPSNTTCRGRVRVAPDLPEPRGVVAQLGREAACLALGQGKDGQGAREELPGGWRRALRADRAGRPVEARGSDRDGHSRAHGALEVLHGERG